MELTPEDMAQRIDRAARQARESDASELHQAQECFDKGTYELRGIASTMRTIDEQRRHLLWAVAGGILAGCLLWSILQLGRASVSERGCQTVTIAVGALLIKQKNTN